MKRAPLPRRPISASRPLLPSRSRMRLAAVVRHRHPIADLEAVLAVEVPGGLVDKVAHHLAFRMQLGKRPLDRLVRRQLLAEHRTGAGVFDALVDAVLRDADARGGLAD